MDLNDLILDNSADWSISGDMLHYKKYVKIPVCYIDMEEVVYIFLDNRIKRVVVKLVRKLLKMGKPFHFAYPDSYNPAGIFRYQNKVVYHYLQTYINSDFRSEFLKMDFDYIGNLVKWVQKEECFEVLKEVYDNLKLEVNKQSYQWISGKKEYDYTEEIRDDYNSMWREIQINILL